MPNRSERWSSFDVTLDEFALGPFLCHVVGRVHLRDGQPVRFVADLEKSSYCFSSDESGECLQFEENHRDTIWMELEVRNYITENLDRYDEECIAAERSASPYCPIARVMFVDPWTQVEI